MVRMVEAAPRNRVPARQPRHRDRHDIEQRNHQGQQWHRQARRQRALAKMAALDRQDPQHEANRERAFIAHKDGSGRKVEYQESRQRSGNRERRDHRPSVLMQSGDRRDTQGRDNSDAGSKAVDSIDQIERISRGDQPENRQRDVQWVVGEEVEMGSPPHEHADRGQLEQQFIARPEIDDVVEQPDEAHRECESRQPGDTMIGQAGNDSDESDRRDESDHHRQAAQQRGWLRMWTVARRMSNDPEVERRRFGQRHHRHDEQKRNRRRECYYKSTGQSLFSTSASLRWLPGEESPAPVGDKYTSPLQITAHFRLRPNFSITEIRIGDNRSDAEEPNASVRRPWHRDPANVKASYVDLSGGYVIRKSRRIAAMKPLYSLP